MCRWVDARAPAGVSASRTVALPAPELEMVTRRLSQEEAKRLLASSDAVGSEAEMTPRRAASAVPM
jgi:hypothetical protein